jgi:hypothetical protein
MQSKHESVRNGMWTVPARDGGSQRGTAPRSRPGWARANAARRMYGRRRAVRMLAMRLLGANGNDIAAVFGTSRGAVYTRLHRLRRHRCGQAADESALLFAAR